MSKMLKKIMKKLSLDSGSDNENLSSEKIMEMESTYGAHK